MEQEQVGEWEWNMLQVAGAAAAALPGPAVKMLLSRGRLGGWPEARARRISVADCDAIASAAVAAALDLLGSWGGEIAPPVSLWASCPDQECPRLHEHDEYGVRRHELPAGHPVVKALERAQRLRLAGAAKPVPLGGVEPALIGALLDRVWACAVDSVTSPDFQSEEDRERYREESIGAARYTLSAVAG